MWRRLRGSGEKPKTVWVGGPATIRLVSPGRQKIQVIKLFRDNYEAGRARSEGSR